MLADAALLVVLSVRQGSGTEECVGARELTRSVERRLKRRVFVPAAEASLRVDVSFTRRGAETEARIALASSDGTPRGTRTLVTAGHCSALDDSLALSVALLVDQPPDPEPLVGPSSAPATSASVASPITSAPSPPAAAARPPASDITIPPEVAAPREPWHARFGAGFGANGGGLPGLAKLAALYLKLVPRHFSPIVLQGEGFWPATVARDGGAGARFHWLRASLAVCPALHEAPAHSLSLCFGEKLGWLSVDGYGFEHDGHERRLTSAVTAGGEGRLLLAGPVSLRGYLGAEVPLTRDRFTSGGRNAASLFQPTPVAISGEIGLEAALW